MALATSLDRTLTLPKALSSWGPNSKVTASRAWGPEAVQTDSPRNLEAHHVISQARLQLPRGILRPPQKGAYRRVWPWQPKRDSDLHRHLYPQLSPAVGSALGASRYPTVTLTLPRTRVTPPKPKPASIPNPAFEPPSGMGPHFSPRERARDRSRFGPGDVPGPNPNPS